MTSNINYLKLIVCIKIDFKVPLIYKIINFKLKITFHVERLYFYRRGNPSNVSFG